MAIIATASSAPPNSNSYFPKFHAALPFLMLFILTLAVNWRVTYYPDNDDASYLAITQETSFSEFITWRYLNWTGRLFTDVLHYGIFSAPLIYWKLLNTCVIVLLAFSWALLLLGWEFWHRLDRASLFTIWFFCAALGWVSHPVLVAAVYWVSGSLDYLWPLVLATFALIPFVEREIHSNEHTNALPTYFYPLSGLAGICACLGVEQAAAMLIGLSVFCILHLAYRERRVDARLGGLLLVFVLASVVSAASPGNFVRYQIELKAFPGYATFSYLKRAYVTISWMLNSVFYQSRMCTIFLMGLILSLSAQLPGTHLRWLRSLMTAFTLLLIVAATNWFDFNKPGGETLTKVLFNFQTPDMMLKDLARYGLYSAKFWLNQVPLIVWGSALIVTMILLYQMRDLASPFTGRVQALILGIGLGALFLVSLSPTIYASGPRTAFAFNLIEIFIIATLYRPLSKSFPAPVTAFLYLFPVINLILIGRYLIDLR
jgi:hypothetical protein